MNSMTAAKTADSHTKTIKKTKRPRRAYNPKPKAEKVLAHQNSSVIIMPIHFPSDAHFENACPEETEETEGFSSGGHVQEGSC